MFSLRSEDRPRYPEQRRFSTYFGGIAKGAVEIRATWTFIYWSFMPIAPAATSDSFCTCA